MRLPKFYKPEPTDGGGSSDGYTIKCPCGRRRRSGPRQEEQDYRCARWPEHDFGKHPVKQCLIDLPALLIEVENL